MSLLPIFLKLDGRPGLLVGAGSVALEKVGSLLKTGVRLKVVAPEARAEIRALAAEGALQWVQKAFEPADLDGQFVVIAATDVPEVNAAVYRSALERNVVCNSVDDVPNCDFYFGSVVSRGDLQIAISTAGESPAVAQRLRKEIDAALPEDLGTWLSNLGELRRDVLEMYPRGDARKALLHELAQRSLCESESCPSRVLARRGLDAAVDTLISSATAKATAGPPTAPFARSAKVSAQDDGVVGEPRTNAGPSTAPFAESANGSAQDDSVVGGEELAEIGRGRVWLVGAGPGDPELLTVKALRMIERADVLLHDDLVPEAILGLAARAEVVNVGKRCGMKSITQDEINALMVEHARAGRQVVRLKSGDPMIFGRAAEEMGALREAGVEFEVVPGITSALAAAAAIQTSLTDRHSASNVIFSTGHHAQSHNDAPLPAEEDATRVVYMPGRDLTLLAEQWKTEGLPAELPCVLVSRAGQPEQEMFATTLAGLTDAPKMQAPSLLLAGWAVREAAAAGRVDSASGSACRMIEL